MKTEYWDNLVSVLGEDRAFEVQALVRQHRKIEIVRMLRDSELRKHRVPRSKRDKKFSRC